MRKSIEDESKGLQRYIAGRIDFLQVKVEEATTPSELAYWSARLRYINLFSAHWVAKDAKELTRK